MGLDTRNPPRRAGGQALEVPFRGYPESRFPEPGRERKSRFCRNTYVSADPNFRCFWPSGDPKTAFLIAPEGVLGRNVKIVKTKLASVFTLLKPV